MSNDEPQRDLRPRARFVGSRLGKYLVGARLAAGGTASVYLARLAGPHNFERLVALKIIHEHLAEEQEFIDMFLDEANLAARLAHPNIVHVYELASEDGVLFIAMEYLHGQPLSQLAKRSFERGERLPADLVAWIGARSAEGLHHAHELSENGERIGLVHRDVSPQNIFVTYDGHVKVVDFGIARAEGRIAKTALGQIKGKFSYMSPEQALGHGYDRRADLFALGATLYEVAVGRRLFKGEDEIDTLRQVVAAQVPDPKSVVPDFPAELTRILKRALAPNPSERYLTADELARDLDAFVEASEVEAQKERLAVLASRIFQEDRRKQEAAIQHLRLAARDDGAVLDSKLVDSDSARAQEETLVASGLDARARSGRRSAVVVVGAVLVLVGGAAALGIASTSRSPTEEPPRAAAPPVSTTVTIDVSLQPDVPATIEVGGALVNERPAKAVLARSRAPILVTVRADGYQDARLEVVPDRDRNVMVPLAAAAVATPAASTESSESAAGAPPRSAPLRAPQAPARGDRRARGSSLITKNPF